MHRWPSLGTENAVSGIAQSGQYVATVSYTHLDVYKRQVINGIAHGPKAAITTCQLHMREFKDGDSITIEPWRAKPFPVMKDLIVDRTAFDRIIESGGYISVNTGQAPDASVIAVPKSQADRAMDAACLLYTSRCV